MRSTTKAVLTKEQLDLLVRNIFGTNTVISRYSELEDGWFNAAFRMELSAGQTVILKVGPAEGVTCMRYERNLMSAEVEALKLMKEAGIAVPEVYGYDPSLTTLPSEYFFMECLEGQPLNKVYEGFDDRQKELIRENLGVINKQINGITGQRFGVLGQKERYTEGWADCFLGLIDDLLLDATEAGAELPAAAQEMKAVFERSRQVLDAVVVPQLVHWDLWDGNVFVKGDQITGIIDCERALWGDPLMEYYFRSSAVTDAFKRGYGISRLTPEEEQRNLLYDMYLSLIWHIECTFRNFEDQGHRNWAKNNLWSSWEMFK